MKRFDDKRNALFRKLADNLKAQREKVFQESPQDFKKRLEIYGPDLEDGIVERMEMADQSVPIEAWMSAWLTMQVADSVVEGSRSDTALFLASVRAPAGIETEITTELTKKGQD